MSQKKIDKPAEYIFFALHHNPSQTMKMKHSPSHFTFAVISALTFSLSSHAQQGITGVTTVNDTATQSSYNDGSLDLNFGEGFDERVTGVSVGASNYNIASNLSTQIAIRRHDANNRQILWYREQSRNGNIRNHEASQVLNMEIGLAGSIINRGTDNVFANTGGTNINNIERIDFVFDQNILRPQNQNQLDGTGFTIMERGGNDRFMVGAITSLDASGNPNGYASPSFVSDTAIWGNSLWNSNTNVLNGETEGFNTYPVSAEVAAQDAAGIFFSLNDLGINVGDDVLGYSVFSVDTATAFLADAAPDTNNLVDWLNTTYFPTDTNSSGNDGGGIDMISGGSGFLEDTMDTTGLFVPVPEPSTSLLSMLLGVMSLLGFRRRRN